MSTMAGPASTRRAFLATSAALTGALMVPLGRAGAATAAPLAANGWLGVTDQGVVTLALPKTEMGQGILTALTMIVAEELGVAPEAISVTIPDANADRFAPVDTTTGGSTSIREMWQPLRLAAATLRAALVGAAARQWGSDPAALVVKDGTISDPASKRQASLAALVPLALAAPLPKDAKPLPASAYRVIGQPQRRLDGPAKVRGTAAFGIDVRLPGMKHATLAQSPVFGGTVKNLNASAARAVPGVIDVIATADCVFVTADSVWTAKRGLEAAAVEWNGGPHGGVNQAEIEAAIVAAVAQPGHQAARSGDLDKARAGAAKTLEAIYYQPFLAHATMEPGDCTGHVTAEGAQFWGGTQVPSDCRAAVAKALGLPLDKVVWHNFLMGGGFGRRLEVDMALRCAELAARVAYPVKLIWTREEDVAHDMYRPAYVDRISAALEPAGQVIGWDHRIAGSSVMARLMGDKFGGVDDDAVFGATDTLYPVANRLVTFQQVESCVPTGWWRAVGGLRNCFVIESFVDELAHAAGQDPLAWRLARITDARARAVLEKAAHEAGWDGAKVPGTTQGLAVLHLWDSYIAAVVDCRIDATQQIHVPRVTVALDCGQAINPLGVRAQLEGGVIFGLSAALYGGVTVAGGRVTQSNFNDVRPLRMNEAPSVVTHLLPTDNAPGGMGEPPCAIVAPALANAIFAATGKRLRRIPLQAELQAG